MEIGIGMFADLSTNLETGIVNTPQQRIKELMAEIKLADEVGLDVFSIGEHHRPDYAVHSPEIMIAGAAAITERIKLTSGVTVLSSADPVKTYQDFAQADLIANGRVELMAGRGSFIESFPLYGFNLEEYDALFEEKLDLLLQLNKESVMSWRGNFRPPLKQQPMYARPTNDQIPVWIAVGGTPSSVERAARLGLPLMVAIIGGGLSQFKNLVDYYRQQYIAHGHDITKMQIGIQPHAFTTAHGYDAADKLFPYYKKQMDRIGKERGWPPYEKPQFTNGMTPDGALFVGDTNQIIDKILYAKSLFGLTRFVGQIDVGGAPHKDLMKAIEIFGTKIAPAIRKA